MLGTYSQKLLAFTRRHETLADLALALGVLLILSEHSHPLVALLFAAALTLPLVWRRRSPLLVFAVLALIAGVQWLAGIKLLGDAALLVALYTVAAHESRRRAVLATAVLGVGAVLATERWGSDAVLKTFVGLSGLAIAAAGLGTSMRHRRAYEASLQDRAARAEVERDQQGQLAAAAERARIAREMHDIVAHNLSVMIALADGAAFAAERSPERSVRAMQTVSATGRQALGEMRRLLGVLRDDASAGTRLPQPGIHEIDLLVGQVRAAGLPVELAIAGEVRALPAGAQLTIFRVVQEALTNSLKHAGPGATAQVVLRYDAQAVDVEIRDDGAGGQAPDGQGLGLDGMRERAAVYAGAVEAGPQPEGGWRVHTRLALTPSGAEA
jgi:signal transduction histidine kinase